MIDIHSHLLFATDDGCRDIEESLALLEEASLRGVTTIFLTPHYLKDSRYTCNNQEKKKKLLLLKKEAKKRNIKIDLILGNEVFFTKDVETLLKEKEVSYLGKNKIVLLEISMHKEEEGLLELVETLTKKGIQVIIAHPERYTVYQKRLDFFEELIKRGALLQGTMTSLIGSYGSKAKKTLIKMLKKKMITFLASDTHRLKQNYYELLPKVEKKLNHLVGKKEAQKILQENAQKIIIR